MEIENYIVASDSALVEMVLGGDSKAFEYLFNRYRGSIQQLYLQRTGGNAEDADDLLQETFIKVYLNLHRYDNTYTFGQWIYAIARNTFVDFMRKRRDDLSIDVIPSENYAASTSSTLTPEESIINSQQKTQLEQFLERMAPRYRKLVELRFFRELSYEEIAEQMEMPMGTVKTQIHRARTQLCRLILESGIL